MRNISRLHHLLFLVVASIISVHPAFAEECSPSAKLFGSFLEMKFWDFDQTDKGWRQLSEKDKHCHLLAAQTIDAYHLDKKANLEPWQERILFFHAGQSYAFESLYEVAARRIEASKNDKEEPNPELHWNLYVESTVAFLKKDEKTLKEKFVEFEKIATDKEKVNVKVVEGLIKCFDRPYQEAYGSCRPK